MRRERRGGENVSSWKKILNELQRSWNYLENRWFYFFINIPKTLNWQSLQLDLEFSSTQRKSFLLYSNMAAPNVNGRLHLKGVHQKPPDSWLNISLTYIFTQYDLSGVLSNGSKTQVQHQILQPFVVLGTVA